MAVITDDDIALLDQKQAASKPLTDDDIARLDAQQPPKDDTPAIIKAGKNIWSGIKQSSADVQAQKTMPEMLLHLVGGAAGNLTNSLVEAAKAAYSYVPQAVKTPIENEVKGVGEAVKSNKTLSDLLLGAQQWAKDNPRAAGNIGAAVNVASVLPVGKAVEAAGKGLADVAGPAVEKAAAAIADKIPSATDKLDKAIQTGVTKGIKPTVIGKPSYDKLTNFYDKANEAVKVIAENRDKLKLVDENGEALHHPRSAAEMAQAVDQAKKVIYDKYHAMATAAGDAGSEFDTEPILKELDKVAADPEEALPMGDPRLKYNPQTRAYANDLKSEIMELHGASPDIIEARIADLNNSLKGFYDGRVTKAKAQIDGSVAKLMRQQLDDNITSAVGEGYQDLKNQYGALKTVENEVAKRALVNARKANKGVADLTDIFTGGDLVAGALSGNPALIAKGLFGRGIKEVYKSLNNPDRYIEKMFKKAYDVVPSVKDVELVKNAVAGVKPLPGPDADNGGLFNNQRPGNIGAKVDKLGFFSNAEAAVNKINMPKAPAEQWLKMLDPAKGVGTKADEMKWIGLDDFLKEKGNQSVTKQEIQDFIDQNKVQLKEVTKGKADIIVTPLEDEPHIMQVFRADDPEGEHSGMVGEIIDNKNGGKFKTPENKRFAVNVPEVKQKSFDTQKEAEKYISDNTDFGTTTKFGKLQLPGGENYREVMLTLPGKDMGYKVPGAHAYGDAADKNRIAHMRLNDRTDAEGKKVLFAEEIQSDWHQAGRKKGYDIPIPIQNEGRFKGFPVGTTYTKNNLGKYIVVQEGETVGSIMGYSSIDDAMSKAKDLVKTKKGVPSAPFSKTWHELAFKKILREAAEKGYDKVAWTTGEQQAERYDLSHQIDNIGYRSDGEGTYEIAAIKDGNTVIEKHGQTPQDLEDIVGKEIATKITNGEGVARKGGGNVKDLSGVDLKVGGEGMKGFYDKILVDYANKYGKKWGAKVGSMELKNGETVHSMDITPTMRKSIVEEGQPIGAVGSKASANNSAGVLPMLGLTGATAGAIGAGGVALENALHKKDEHGQSFADILKGIFDNMQGGK